MVHLNKNTQTINHKENQNILIVGYENPFTIVRLNLLDEENCTIL